MEFAGNLLDSLRERVSPLRPDAGTVDWPDLHARFSAAHAAALELGRNGANPGSQPGSFGNWDVAFRGDREGTPHFNPTALADGKRAAGSDGDDAGNVLAGG